MPRRKSPYSFRRPESQRDSFIYRSLRVPPDLWPHLEALAARESISMNSLCLALFSVALDLDETPEGRSAITAACNDWRARWEYTEAAKRRARLSGEEA